MATNLQENLRKGGASLHVHNRTESKAKTLIDQGAIWESSPAEIAKKCHVTFSSMFADDGLKSTFRKWLSGGPQKGSIYVDSSTVYPGTVKELTDEAKQAGKAMMSPTTKLAINKAVVWCTNIHNALTQQEEKGERRNDNILRP